MVENNTFVGSCKLESEFLFKMILKMEGTKSAALISRKGLIIDKIIGGEGTETDFSEMMDLALSATNRMALELNHGLFRGKVGKFLLMDVGDDYVLVILFDNLMDSNEIFSHYWQIIHFIGETFLDLLEGKV